MAAEKERKKRKVWFEHICSFHGRLNPEKTMSTVRVSVKGIRAEKTKGCGICRKEKLINDRRIA